MAKQTTEANVDPDDADTNSPTLAEQLQAALAVQGKVGSGTRRSR